MGCCAEEPAEDTNPLSQLFGGGKRAAKEAEKGSKQVYCFPGNAIRFAVA